jgi:purine-nucleoside phosphorylase
VSAAVAPDPSHGEAVERAAGVVRRRVSDHPTVGIVLGSGLGQLARAVRIDAAIPYGEVPGMPHAAVEGHAGQLLIGDVEGVPCAMLAGRAHFYEGHSMEDATFGVRLLARLGVETLILTNAAGGLNPDYRAGDAMLIADHLFLPGMAGHHPLRGPNDDSVGPRFPAMVGAYDTELRAHAKGVRRTSGIGLHEGVYAMVSGPSYETSAELRFLRLAGADAVGMSTCPEVVVARHAGLRVLAISLIANLALHDHPEVLTHDQVVAASERAAAGIEEIVRGVIRALGERG